MILWGGEEERNQSFHASESEKLLGKPPQSGLLNRQGSAPHRGRGHRRSASLREKGAALKATEQPIDTSTAAGKAFLDMLGVFAEFETNIRKERQLEGIGRYELLARSVGRRPPRSENIAPHGERPEPGLGEPSTSPGPIREPAPEALQREQN